MNREFHLIFAYCVMQSCSQAKYFFLRIGVGSFDGVRDFNADLCKNTETTSVCSIAFNQKSDVVVFVIWGKIFLRRKFFWGEI